MMLANGTKVAQRARRFFLLIAMTMSAMPGQRLAYADEPVSINLSLKDHVFTPAEIKVPANKTVSITVINEDASAEEFESSALKIEKAIAGKKSGVVRLKPLAPGRYPFVGEYHENTAKGTIIVE
jgi:plastocyanin